MLKQPVKSAEAKSFGVEWLFPRAIEQLFLDAVPAFSSVTGVDARYESAKRLAANIRRCLTSAPDGDTCIQFCKSYPELEPLLDVLRRTKMPLDKGRRTQALIWLRVAVLSGFRISATVFEHYSRWRAEVHGAYLVRKSQLDDVKKLTISKKTTPSPNASRPLKPDTNFSIEEVVFAGRLFDDGNDFRHSWTLIPASKPEQVHGPGDGGSKRARRQAARPVKRSAAEVCGRALLELLQENLAAIASGPKAGIVRKKRGDVKFASTLSRRELARRLKDMDGDLEPYSESTILRALPTLVQCPRGRRGGRAV